MSEYLPIIWAGIVGFAVIMYVLLDGFDLGIGILFSWVPHKQDRDVMMNSIAPVWDGNETWMVFGAALLYGAFPIAYSLLLPTLYMPIMVMTAALIFRGVAFEFRFKAEKSRFLWDFAFSAGSMLAAFCQGVVLGTFVQGYGHTVPNVADNYEWLTPFSLMTGFAVIAGYALLGATWLIMKTEGELQLYMFQAAKVLLCTICVFLAIVSIWTPFIDPSIMERWFSTPNFYYLLPLPILTGLSVIYASYALFKHYEHLPFILSILLFILAYIGLGVSSWPYLIPRSVTIWQAASSTSSLEFLLVGTCILLPVLIAYSIYAYWVFKGKVKPEHGYH
jgi:cytochrome d ubiquinol oxidase subunit II